MATENEYENVEEKYETKILKDLRTSVRSIEDKMQDIRDELREHFERQNGSDWSPQDLYENGDL